MSDQQTTHQATEPEVRFERAGDGRVGHIILNRPKAINALTHGMVTAIAVQLREWAADDGIRTVLLTGAGERGLCAGGDIVGLYRAATGGDPDAAARFWADEYRLDALIARYPKPFVALQDGVVLGGGIGLSAHASHRIVTERSSLGLPEVTIGFVPDVGSLFLLARAPGELGTHLALSAGSVGAGDAIAVGLSEHYLPTDRIPDLIDGLGSEHPDAVLDRLAGAAPPSTLTAQRDWIDAAYEGDDVRTVLERLDALGEDARGGQAADAAATIRTKSPTALAVTLAALRRAAVLPSLEEALEQDYRVSVHALAAPDFAEGVRAQVIDKDRQPRWNPQQIPGPGDVDHYFAAVPGGPALVEGSST